MCLSSFLHLRKEWLYVYKTLQSICVNISFITCFLILFLKHKNIIRLDQAFLHKSDLVLIMEHADGGELKGLVKEKDGIDEMRVRDITR